MLREVAQMALLACDRTPSLLSETEAADFKIRIPKEARLDLYNMDVADIKHNQDGTLDPTENNLKHFAAAVKALLEQYFPEKYKPRALQ